jgi:hypothetical protein
MSNYPPNNGNPPEYPPVPPTPPYNNPGPGYPPPSNPGYPPSGDPGMYPPPSNPGYPPSGDPGMYPPPSNPGYPPSGNPGMYPPPNNPGYPPSSAPGTYPPPPPYPPYTDPNAGYNAAPGYNYGVPPVNNQPLPLGVALRQLPGQYWRVISRPGAATFAAEMGKAAWNIIWVQLGILALVSALITGAIFGIVLPGVLSTMASSSSSSMTNMGATIAAMQSIAAVASIGMIIFSIIGFFIGTGIYFLIAKVFGGKGTFVQYCYCYLLYYIPLSIVGIVVALISLIPVLGWLIGLALGIYEIVLQVFMTMAVHRLSGGRATLAVLILPIVLIILSCGLGIVAFAGMMHAMQQIQHSSSY